MAQILLIDDNLLQLRARETILRDGGFSVFTASTAADALAYLRDPQLSSGLRGIVTDHIMPGASGATFVRELRKAGVSAPVLVVTGAVEAEDEYAGLAVSFLNKPCLPAELIRRVRQLVKSHP